MEMWKALSEFTKELFGLDVVSSDIPEGVQHANRVQFLGAGVAWQEATRTAIVNLDGSGTPIGLVTDAAPGLVNEYPDGLLRLCSSNGTTDGATWLVCSKTLLDSAIADHAIGLPKLHAGGASTGNVLKFDGSAWVPGTDSTIGIEAGTGISVDWSGNTATIACTLSIPSVPTYVAGAGMTASGTTFNVIAGNGSVVVNADELHVGFDATVPLANGVAAHGDSVYAAAANHVHPAGAESVVYHASCRVACVSNVTIATPGAVHRGLTLTGTGTDRLLLLGQSNPAENGIYVWNGPGTAMGRAADWTGTIDLSVTHCIPCFRASDTVDDDGPNISDRSGMWFTTSSVASFVVGTDAMAGRFLSPEKNVLHEPCECATTRNIDLHSLEIPYRLSGSQLSAFDTAGYTLQDDDRVFLAHQTDPLEDGPWTIQPDVLGESSISRPDDWTTGSVIRANTVHEFPIKRGMSGPSKWFACKATDALIGDTVVGTGVACDWYRYGAETSTPVLHPPAFIHGTRNYDTTAFPAAVEGQTILNVGTRILLTKQTDTRENGIWATDVDNEDGTWTLARVADWPEGATIEAGTVHYISVEYGDLHPPHLAVLNVHSDMVVWVPGMSGGSYPVTTSLIPEHDVIDVEIPGGETYTFTPPGASETNRKSMIIAGIIYIGDEVSTAPASTTTLLPLEVSPPYDETGIAWQGDNGAYLTRQGGGNQHQGTYAWSLAYPSSGSGSQRIYRPITVPAHCSCKVSAWRSQSNRGTGSIRLGITEGGTEYGSMSSPANSPWTKFTSSTVPAQSTEQTIYLYVSTTLSSAGGVSTWLDAIQIDFIPDGIITSEMLIHQQWEPDSTPYINVLPLVGDNAQHQVTDPNETWGDALMYDPTYSDACEFALNVFNINRFLRATIYPKHWGVEVATPTIPTVAAPAQVYT